VELKFFSGKRQLGLKDPKFLDSINAPFIVLAATCLGYGLLGWRKDTWIKPADFRSDRIIGMALSLDTFYDILTSAVGIYKCHTQTWARLPDANKVKIISDLQALLHKEINIIPVDTIEAYDNPTADDFLDYQVVCEEKIASPGKNDAGEGGDVVELEKDGGRQDTGVEETGSIDGRGEGGEE